MCFACHCSLCAARMDVESDWIWKGSYREENITKLVRRPQRHIFQLLSSALPQRFCSVSMKKNCLEQWRLVLSSHCSHREAVKCNLYIYSLVYNTKPGVHSSQPVHVSPTAQMILRPYPVPPARTYKLLTGSSTKLWSVCALQHHFVDATLPSTQRSHCDS